MNQPKLDRITQDPTVLDGLPTIRDTGITVSEVVKALMGGKTADEVLAEHPQLESEDVTQALVWGVRDLVGAIHGERYELIRLLTSIHGYSMLLRSGEGITAQDKKDYLDRLIQSSTNAQEFIIGFADWANLIYGSAGFTFAKASLTEILNQIIEAAPKKNQTSQYQLLGLDNPCFIKSSWYLELAIRDLIVSPLFLSLKAGAKITIATGELTIKLQISRYAEWLRQYPFVEIHHFYGSPTPLFLVAHIIRQHGSELKIHPTEDGVTFEFELPIWSEPHE